MIAAAYDWRLAFLLLGGAGLVAAAAVWGLVREPKRGATDAPVRPAVTPDPAGEVVSFGATLRMFATRPTPAPVSPAAASPQCVHFVTMVFRTFFLMGAKPAEPPQIAPSST